MNDNSFKNRIEGCECKREHTCPIKHVVSGGCAIRSLSLISSDYKRILLVADENTYAVAGKETEGEIGNKIFGRVIFSGKSVLIPNEAAIERIEEAVGDADLILGVGSGVINDLCKYVSFKATLPYFIVATAPSMDGYASRGAAMILGGMKVTVNAHVPEAIIADSNILAGAPMEMILAGYGDIIGKYSCLADWKLSAIVNGEYICERILSMTYREIEKTRSIAKGLLARDPKAIETLTNALISVGFLMAYVGNSRPASGAEHHFSHYFEIVGIIKGEQYFPHGIDVFYSTLETAKLRDAILSLSKEDIRMPTFDRNKYVSEIERVYGPLSGEVIALQDKLGWYEKGCERVEAYLEHFEKIKEVLRGVPSYAELLEMLSEVGMKYSDFARLYGEKKIRDAYLYAKDLKDRYTVLWMYSDLIDSFR